MVSIENHCAQDPVRLYKAEFVFAHDAPTGPGEFDTFCCVVHVT